MTNEEHFIGHEEVHARIELWMVQASDLYLQLIERMEALEQRLDNLNARLREWEVGPR